MSATATKLAFMLLSISRLFHFSFLIYFTHTVLHFTSCFQPFASTFTWLLYHYWLTSDLENLSAMPTHVMNFSAKFRSNPSTKYRNVVQNSC